MKPFPVVAEEETEVEVAPKAAKAPMAGGIRIPIPDGFKMPQGKRDGEVIEAIVKLRPMGDHLMLDELNGIKLSNAAEEEAEYDETADENADKESKMMAEEDGDEQFASELSNAVRQMQ